MADLDDLSEHSFRLEAPSQTEKGYLSFALLDFADKGWLNKVETKGAAIYTVVKAVVDSIGMQSMRDLLDHLEDK